MHQAAMTDDHDTDTCPDCGKPADSFACRIRHVQVNTGWAKAANDIDTNGAK
jgi:hypothetical protein